ncbi:MAG: hemolysin family protein [Geminicoccaceae bacterium]
MSVLIEIVAVLGLVLVNGFLALSELALVSSRRSRLEQLAASGTRGAPSALRLIEDPTRVLSTVQVGITLVGILAGAYSGATLGEDLAQVLIAAGMASTTAKPLAIAAVVVCITYLSLILGELVPKRLALANPEGFAVRVAPVVDLLTGVVAPAVWLLRHSTEAVIRWLGLPAGPSSRVSDDEIRALLAEGAEVGVFASAEQDMISAVLRIADRPVRSIMTPRTEIVWLDAGEAPRVWEAKVLGSQHSRFPVCRGTLDEVIGHVHVRDVLDAVIRSKPLDLEGLVHPAVMVHEATTNLRLIERLRATPAPMVIVLDEYGAVEGLVTPTDLFAAITGAMPDSSEDQPEATRRHDGSWLVDGRLGIHELERYLHRSDLAHDEDYATVAGLVLWRLRRMARVGDRFEWNGLRFEVVDLDGRRIDKVMIEPVLVVPD